MAKIGIVGIRESDGEVFKTIPAGKYPCRITKIEDGESSDQSKYPGSPVIRIGAKVMKGNEHADAYLQWTVPLPHDQMNDEERRQAVARIKRILIAANIEVEEDAFDTDDLMGAELGLIISEDTKDGITRNNIKDQYRLTDE